MQITVGNVKLLGILPTESAQGFSVVPETDTQESKAIGAAAIALFPRGNKKITWTFVVQRTHTSAEAAAYFCARYESMFPVQGKLTYVTDAGEFYYAGAEAKLTKITFQGASSTVAYRVTSGGASNPGAGGGGGLDAGNPTYPGGGGGLVTW